MRTIYDLGEEIEFRYIGVFKGSGIVKHIQIPGKVAEVEYSIQLTKELQLERETVQVGESILVYDREIIGVVK